MFKIRIELLEALNASAVEDFHRRLVQYIQKELPEEIEKFNETELELFLRECEECATRHNIESESGIMQYVCLALDSNPRFADDPAIAAYLAEPDADPEEWLEEMVDYLADEID